VSADVGPAETTPPPQVDHPEIEEALRRVADLEHQPLAEHQQRLSRVHEVLHAVLQADPDQP